MPETDVVSTPPAMTEQDYNFKVMEAMAFNEAPPARPEQFAEAAAPPPEGDTTTTAPVTATPSTEAATTPAPDDTLDADAFIEQQFGVKGFEALKTEWEALQALKKNPPKAEHSFKDDTHKKYYQYFAEGKEEELYNSLHARRQLNNLGGMNDEQQIKLFLKLNNPLFDDELIDYNFKQNYGFDDSDFKDDEGKVIDPVGLRFAQTNAKQKMMNDLAKDKDFFSQYQTKFELPDITPQPVVDEQFQAYKASIAEAEEMRNSTIIPGLNSLKAEDLQMSYTIKDDNNQINFDIAVAADKADVDKAKADALNLLNVFQEISKGQDGKFAPAKLVSTLLKAQQFDKYVQTIARQSVNAERKRVLEKETPNHNGQRQYTTVLPNELDKQAQMAFSV